MSRKLILASAATMLFASTDVAALGLGGIRTQSGLNQPFIGEIALYDVNPDERDSIQIALASQEAFDQAGIERYYALTKLKFALEMSANGQALIRVTSREPIREPYLDLLLEVYWPKGQLVKEYTVLLEPPERLKPTALPPKLPSAARSSSTTNLPGDAGAFPLMIGPIGNGAGLWRVARDNAPVGATIAQTALALYRNNQDAFTRGNINRLITGKMLMIPTQAELFALDVTSAEREFATARRGGAVARAPLTEIPDMAQLRIIGVRTPAPSETEPALAPKVSTTASHAHRVEQDLLVALETTESTRQEAQELRQRVQELETQLVTIQQQLQQRSAELPPVQNPALPGVLTEMSAGAAEPVAKPVSTADAPVAIPALTPPAPTTPVALSPTTAPPVATEPLPAATPAPDALPVAVVPVPLPPAHVTAPAATLNNPLRPTITDTVSSAESTASPLPPVSMWQTLMLPLAGLAGLSALGILGFAWVTARRRAARHAEEDLALDLRDTENDDALEGEPTAFLSSDDAETAVLPASAASAPYRLDDDEEPETPMSLISSLSDFDAETDAVDPLSEADIYMAYGKHDEAQALLLKEMQRFPTRLDIKFKLAEACIGTKNIQGVTSVMESIVALGGDHAQARQWQRLQDLAAPLLQPDDAPTTDADSFFVDIKTGLPPPAPATSRPAPAAAAVQPAELADVTLNLDALLPDSESTPLMDSLLPHFAVAEPEPNDSLLLDLTDIQRAVLRGSEPSPLAKVTATAALPSPFGDDELGRLLGQPPPFSLVKAAEPVKPALEPLRLPDAFDLDLELNINPPLPKPAVTLTKPAEDVDSPDSELVLMLDDPRFEQLEDLDSLISAAEHENSVNPPIESLSDTTWQMNTGLWDETATKLDLARAYLDMDDPDAAREILKEVITEGREEQQAAARLMLAQIR